jgi:alpha-1,6-mannosyltransferase
MPMRIADVAEFYSPTGGGVRSYIDRKFEAAAEAGHELFVLAPGPDDGFERRAGGGVVTLRSPRLPMDPSYHVFWSAAPVHRCLDQLQPDLVEASSPWRGASIVGTWRAPTPRAMFFHADPIASYPQRWLARLASRERIDRMFEWFWAYLRRLVGGFDSVVVGGAWLAPRLESQGIGPVKSVPLGVDRRRFSPVHRDEQLRARLLEACALPRDGKLLLGVGRFHAEKRWPMVISAVAMAAMQLPVGLVLVGDGVERGRIARAAAGKPYVQVVPSIRDRDHLAILLASADALVHGCESETFGLVVGEALASGLPLVVPDRGGCAQLADPAVAEVFQSGETTAAAAAIQRLFERDQDALRAAALEVAGEVRSDTQHFTNLFDHYDDLASGAARRAGPTSAA